MIASSLVYTCLLSPSDCTMVELHKHKTLARYFRKQVCRHKVHLEENLDRDVPEPAMSGWHSHDLKLC